MRPLFIVGCPRSGTTLLGSILGSAPRCAMIPTTEFARDLYALDPANSGMLMDSSRLQAIISGNQRFKNGWGAESVPECTLPDVSVKLYLEQIIEKFCNNNYNRSFDIWVDHTPANVFLLDILITYFQDARFLHLVRDPRAVISSTLKLDWGITDVVQGSYNWMLYLCSGLAAEQAPNTQDRILRVSYERLLGEPEATMRSICAFADIEYVDGLHTSRGFKVTRTSRKIHTLVDRPITASRIDGWNEDLSERQIEIIEFVCGGTLAYLGYTPRFGITARRPQLTEKASIMLKRLTLKPVHKVKYFLRNSNQIKR